MCTLGKEFNDSEEKPPEDPDQGANIEKPVPRPRSSVHRTSAEPTLVTFPSRMALPGGDVVMKADRVVLAKPDNDIKVATVSSGNYHTILLCADRQVQAACTEKI